MKICPLWSLLSLIIPTGMLFLVSVHQAPVQGQTVTINSGTSTYDSHPSTASENNATWYAWHGYHNSRDQIIARRIAATGPNKATAAPPIQVSEEGSVHGPPIVVRKDDDSIAIVWSRRNAKTRWQVVMRPFRNGQWAPTQTLSDESLDAIYPTAIQTDDDTTVAWSAHVDGHWRVRGCQIHNDRVTPSFDISAQHVDAFRPVLVAHEEEVWAFWDQYHQHHYSVHGRTVLPHKKPAEQVSPPGEYCLTPTALSHKNGLHVAWLKKQDVVGGPRVISQRHTFHAAVGGAQGWKLIETSDGNTAAELTHGLMAKIEPRPVATGGYLGARLRPMLVADDDRVWLLWERKSDHRGSTPRVAGDLVGRPSLQGKWEAPVVLHHGRVDYHTIHPPVARRGKLRLLASPLPQHGLRHYESFEVSLTTEQPLEQDDWTGWQAIQLPVAAEVAPRRSINVDGTTYQLFWADLHCHNGLTADAEGEPDEMHFYARDRARLDVVVFTNNDFYNVPLTQYDYSLGALFAKTFTAVQAEPHLLSLPGFEWTSRIPGVTDAKLSDPGNWVPPYRNRSYPNHRSVIYPPSGGPLVHFTEVGNDIARLNQAVERAGGVTLSQHNAFKLSGHPVEVGMELTSGWSNYIATHPKLFHEPLSRGARLGFTANGDTHRRAPGLSGALTGVYAEDLSAESVLSALRSRRCFATMGSQMFLDARAGKTIMGGEAVSNDGTIRQTIHAIGTRPITKARLVRDGKVIYEAKGDGKRELRAEYHDMDLAPGLHWHYWEVHQVGISPVLPGNLMPAHGHLAWSSPIFTLVK